MSTINETTENSLKKNSEKITARQIVRWIKEGLIEQSRRSLEQRSTFPVGPNFYAREVGGCQLRCYLRRTGCSADELGGFRFEYLGRLGESIERISLDATRLGSSLPWKYQAKASREYVTSDKRCAITGKCDALLEGIAGIEVKSCDHEVFDSCRSLKAVYENRPDYIRQCLIYTWLFDVPEFYLILIDRNDARFRSFHIKSTPKEVERYLDELAETETAIQKKEPPDPSPGYACYVCGYRENHCPAWQETP